MLAKTTRALTEAHASSGPSTLPSSKARSAQRKSTSSPADRPRRRRQRGHEPAPGRLPRATSPRAIVTDPNPEAFMDRRDLLTYHQASIDRSTAARVRPHPRPDGAVHPVLDEPAAIRARLDPDLPRHTIPTAARPAASHPCHRDQRLRGQGHVPLTDVTRPGPAALPGHFPGSHLRRSRNDRAHPQSAHAGGRAAAGKAGDACVFPHAIWQGRHPTAPRKARKTVALQLLPDVHAAPLRFGTPTTRRCSSAARSTACWATSAMISVQATSSMRRKTRKP